jgi:hypothetical protein
MPKENSNANANLIKRLEQAKTLLDEAIGLAKGSSRVSRLKTVSSTKTSSASDHALDFSMPIRAFVKRHGKGLSGPKIFVLLVAYLTKGDLKARVSLAEIEKNWNKLTSLLGTKFNPAHTSRARENDWLNTEKTGSYHLRPKWKEILS